MSERSFHDQDSICGCADCRREKEDRTTRQEITSLTAECAKLKAEVVRLENHIKGIRDYVQKCMKHGQRLSYTDVLTLLSAGRVFLSRPDNPALKEKADG